MYDSNMQIALIAAAKVIKASERSNANVMFDALVNLELISRAAVQDHLVTTSLEPKWRKAAKSPDFYH